MANEDTKKQFAEFLETYPLYRKLKIELREYYGIHSDKIIYWCDICKDRMPFRDWFGRYGSADGVVVDSNNSKVQKAENIVNLRCTGCNKFTFRCWYELSVEGSWIRKVGQSPQWSIDIPTGLEKELGEDAALYKKALILMSQSYGLGACVYLRRIIENHVNPLLELILEIRKSEGLDDRLEEVTSALAGKDFTTKIKLAAEILPDSLVVDGANPIRLIYLKLSVGIHSLTDEEAMDNAMAVRAAFEYVIRELRRQLQTKREFIEAIRELNSR